MTSKPIVVGLGEVLWDMLAEGKRPGGAPANVAYHAAHHGAEGWLISAVGQDALGDELQQQLHAGGVQLEMARVPFPTGRVEVTLQQGIPSYRIVENTAWDHIPLTQAASRLLARADGVCFGSLAFRTAESRRNLSALLAGMPAETLKVLDINLRPPYYSKELLETLLGLCNALKINDDELKVLADYFNWPTESVCAELMRRYGLRFLILTAGAQYSNVYAHGTLSHLPTPAVQVVDTVGAGDSFTAAFVCAWLRGESLERAHQQAVQTAARVCGHAGAWD